MIERGVTAKARRSSTEALTTRSRKPPQNDGFAYHGRPSSACRLKSSSPHADESVAIIIDAMPRRTIRRALPPGGLFPRAE